MTPIALSNPYTSFKAACAPMTASACSGNDLEMPNASAHVVWVSVSTNARASSFSRGVNGLGIGRLPFRSAAQDVPWDFIVQVFTLNSRLLFNERAVFRWNTFLDTPLINRGVTIQFEFANYLIGSTHQVDCFIDLRFHDPILARFSCFTRSPSL